MFSSPTIYRYGARVVEVLPGESHSAAWAYVTARGPVPVSYPCSFERVRRRAHRSDRRAVHSRPALARVA
jgi:hypothetical protein